MYLIFVLNYIMQSCRFLIHSYHGSTSSGSIFICSFVILNFFLWLTHLFYYKNKQNLKSNGKFCQNVAVIHDRYVIVTNIAFQCVITFQIITNPFSGILLYVRICLDCKYSKEAYYLSKTLYFCFLQWCINVSYIY